MDAGDLIFVDESGIDTRVPLRGRVALGHATFGRDARLTIIGGLSLEAGSWPR